MHEVNSIANQQQSSPAAAVAEAVRMPEKYDIETDGNDRLPIQLKLSVGAPNDPMEHQADAMADKVMRMPEASFIQRKSSTWDNEYDDERVHLKPLAGTETPFIHRKACSCGCNNSDDEHIHRKSLTSKITPFIQAKSDSGPAVSDSVSSRIKSSMGGGSPMPDSTMSFMENRFGADFSNVKIHDGSEPAQLSQSLNAKAFTVSNNIYFNSGQYQPNTDAGKHLLAHELTHTVQQGGAAEQNIQRRVSAKMDMIRDRLTYGFFDWAVTDSNVSDVIKELRTLSPQDLRDTVVVMEKEGLVTRLYDNLEESDERKKDYVPGLMQDVQNARFSANGINGSCTTKQKPENAKAMAKIQGWAQKCIDAVNSFISGKDPVESARIGALLNKYFFHEAQTGVLAPAQRISYARQIVERLTNMSIHATGTNINCVSPFDLSCTSAGNTTAYVHYNAPNVLRVCNSFFKDSEDSRVATVFHELMHYHNTNVHDTGYRHERIFEYLPPDRSVGNADSYSTFAVEIMLGKNAASNELREVHDSVQGCNAQQKANLLREIAFANRMMQNMVNQLDDGYSVQNNGHFAATHFHSANHQDLIKFVDKVHAVKKKIPWRITFHCNVNSAQTTNFLPFINTGEHYEIKLTQPYFNLASENQRVANLIAIFFNKYSSGMTGAMWPNAPNYRNQTLNQAYTNPASYASYAQAVSFDSDEWNFADAGIRYREEISRTLERIGDEFDDGYRDEGFKSRIISNLISLLSVQLGAAPAMASHQQLETNSANLLQKVPVIKIFLDRMYHDYTGLNTENFLTALFAFEGKIPSNAPPYRALETQYKHALTELSTSFVQIMHRINLGQAVKFEDWTDYPALLTKYRTESKKSLNVIPTYKEYLIKLYAAKEDYLKFEQQLAGSHELDGLSIAELALIPFKFTANTTDLNDEIDSIEISVRFAIKDGKRFNPRDPDFTNPATLVRRFKSQLKNIVHPPKAPGRSKLPVQPKLEVGAVDDPLEHQADAMADKIMRMPEAPSIQRKECACGCMDRDDEHVHLKPLANQITPFIQAKNNSNAGSLTQAATEKIQRFTGCSAAQNQMINDALARSKRRSTRAIKIVADIQAGTNAGADRTMTNYFGTLTAAQKEQVHKRMVDADTHLGNKALWQCDTAATFAHCAPGDWCAGTGCPDAAAVTHLCPPVFQPESDNACVEPSRAMIFEHEALRSAGVCNGVQPPGDMTQPGSLDNIFSYTRFIFSVASAGA